MSSEHPAVQNLGVPTPARTDATATVASPDGTTSSVPTAGADDTTAVAAGAAVAASPPLTAVAAAPAASAGEAATDVAAAPPPDAAAAVAAGAGASAGAAVSPSSSLPQATAATSATPNSDPNNRRLWVFQSKFIHTPPESNAQVGRSAESLSGYARPVRSHITTNDPMLVPPALSFRSELCSERVRSVDPGLIFERNKR